MSSSRGAHLARGGAVGLAENPLKTLGAEFWIDAANSKPGEQWALNQGTSGQVLRAKYGSVGRTEIRTGVGLLHPGTAVGDYANLQLPAVPVNTYSSIRFEVEMEPPSLNQVDCRPVSLSALGNGTITITLNGLNKASFEWHDGVGWKGITSASALPANLVALAGVLEKNVGGGLSRATFYTAPSIDGPWTLFHQGTVASSTQFSSENMEAFRSTSVGSGNVNKGVTRAMRLYLDDVLTADVDFTRQPDFTTSFTCSTGQTVTISAANPVDTNDPLLLTHEGRDYIYFPGVVGGYAQTNHSSVLSSLSTLDFRVKVRFDALGSTQHLMGTDSTHFAFLLNSFNQLQIYALNTPGFVQIGNVNSSVIPGLTAGRDIWLRGRLTVATAQCDYWYSYDETDVVGNVSWSSLSGGVGTNAGTTPVLTGSLATKYGCHSAGIAGMGGRMYVGTMICNSVVRSHVTFTTAVAPSILDGNNFSAGGVVIYRPATGRKPAYVERPIWLFATDDFLEVADNDLLDFAAGQNFTAVVVGRQFGASYNGVWLSKRASAFSPNSDVGWNLVNSGSDVYVNISDGTTRNADQLTLPAPGSLVVAVGRRDGTTLDAIGNLTSGGSTNASAVTGTLANSLPMRIGANSVNSVYSDGEILAVALFRRALSGAEIQKIVNFYKPAPSQLMANMGAVFAIDAADSVAGEQWVLNRGSGGQVLRAQYGSIARAEVRSGVGLVCPGPAGNYATVPANAAFGITGPIEMVARVQHDTWVPTTASTFFARRNALGSYQFRLSSNITPGALEVVWWVGGSARVVNSGASVPPFTAGQTGWVKVTLDPYNIDADYVVNFYYAADQEAEPTSWTFLATQSGDATGGIDSDLASDIIFGSGSPAANQEFTGVIKRGIIRNGIGGTTVLDVDFAAQTNLVSSFVASTGQTVTLTSANAVDTNDPLLLPWSGESYVYFPGTAGDADRVNTSTLTTGASNVYDIRVLADLDSMTPAVDRTLFSYTAGDPNRSIRWILQTSGKLVAEVTPTGSIASYIAMTSTTTVGASGKLWFRFTIEGNVAGSYRGRFYRCDGSIASPTPSDWVQVGSDITGAGFSFATCSATWGTVGASALQGKWYRASLATSIDGAPLIDMRSSDITDPAATSFTCTTGQTCSIGRSSSGRKTVVVIRPIWLFGSDDYLEVADNSLLDVGGSQDFSVVVVYRIWPTPSSYGRLVTKSNTGTDGWELSSYTTTKDLVVTVADNADTDVTYPYAAGAAPALGTLSVGALVIDRTAALAKLWSSGSFVQSNSLGTIGDTSNAQPMRIGTMNTGGAPLDGEVMAVGIFRRALSAAEIAQVVDAYAAS